MLRRHVLALLCCLPLSAVGQERPIAFTGATILPVSGDAIENGTLLVQRGRIVAVGTDVRIPSGAEHRDVSGKVIMPGLVDTHSHIGQAAGGDRSAPIQPDVRVLDSINVRHAGIAKARAGGITTVNVMPGSGHLLSGQTLYLKLRRGTTVDDLSIRLDDGSLAGGIKMANGTNPIRPAAPFPGTRAKSAALMRAQLVAAQEYCAKMADRNLAAERKPARDLGKEALCEALDGRRIVHHHTHRHDDILTVLRLAEEFKLRVVLQHAVDAWLVVDEIAASGAPVSTLLLDSPGGKLETLNVNSAAPAILERAGVPTGFHTDDPIIDSRLLLRQAAMAVRAGMSREGALKALTINGARMLDLDRRTGSLEAGKDADFIILSGDPLSVYTQVLETWVEGAQTFNRADPDDALRATGGYGGSRDAMETDVLEMEGGV
ncbi:amidohydrolase family protein [Pseudofulvimonas gallinarii]|uniref:Imidazolonepropionase-like amidohydrolase n=1 Tax=Pseudofulvimonas gallinarii TaxID=634155 RepID=A0A4V2UVJ3_9GAMM|nr:amidohydrolase family protein [Pseudofulvimonas gallinarii]TCS96007.1 imidazolonepropionase-like amidohydrolase [Pseudofulvimonas gallinarii]